MAWSRAWCTAVHHDSSLVRHCSFITISYQFRQCIIIFLPLSHFLPRIPYRLRQLRTACGIFELCQMRHMKYGRNENIADNSTNSIIFGPPACHHESDHQAINPDHRGPWIVLYRGTTGLSGVGRRRRRWFAPLFLTKKRLLIVLPGMTLGTITVVKIPTCLSARVVHTQIMFQPFEAGFFWIFTACAHSFSSCAGLFHTALVLANVHLHAWRCSGRALFLVSLSQLD